MNCACAITHDRDVNAARNINIAAGRGRLAEGTGIHALGEDVKTLILIAELKKEHQEIHAEIKECLALAREVI